MIRKKNLKELSGAVGETYKNFEVEKCNDHVLRMSVNNGIYDWHCHHNSDELFIVLEGCLMIDTHNQTTYVLNPYDFLKIPKNIIHRTRSSRRTVNLTFERKDTETTFLPFDESKAGNNDNWKVQNLKCILQGTTWHRELPIASVNDHVLRSEPEPVGYSPHYHPDSEELLMGIDHEMIITSGKDTHSLLPEEILRIPNGVVHGISEGRQLSFTRSDSKTILKNG